MTSKTAYKKFKLRINRLDTNYSDNISEKDFCELFNKAQFHFVNDLLRQEEKDKITQTDLQTLLKDAELTGIHNSLFYEVEMPDDWYYVVRVSCIDNQCGLLINCILVQESNINRLLQDANWQPSIYWQETIFTLGNDNLRIYNVGDEGFEIKNTFLTYYRIPVKIDIKTPENNIDGLESEDIDPEWYDSIAERIIDLAVLIGSSDMDNTSNFQSKTQLRQILV